MSRPFMLYHWAPSERRKSILRYGLCPKKKSKDNLWRPPYICFSRYPNLAWALSATHSNIKGWDLWCCWSDEVGKGYETLNNARIPKDQWWMIEYRVYDRIKKSKIWFVGTRKK